MYLQKVYHALFELNYIFVEYGFKIILLVLLFSGKESYQISILADFKMCPRRLVFNKEEINTTHGFTIE